jgi:hypothetical protein
MQHLPYFLHTHTHTHTPAQLSRNLAQTLLIVLRSPHLIYRPLFLPSFTFFLTLLASPGNTRRSHGLRQRFLFLTLMNTDEAAAAAEKKKKN